MQRFGLRDDQWERIKDFLPGRDGHVGGNAADTDCSSMRFFIDIGRAFRGAICQHALATGRSCTNASTGGPKLASSSAFSSFWPVITTMNI